MITLANDCLVFQLASGENVPFSSDMVSVELMGETAQWFDPDFVKEAAKAVFHYFKKEQGRQTVSVAEFAEALEKVLGGFATAEVSTGKPEMGQVIEADLASLACESGPGWELFFFPRLRNELRHHIGQGPQVLRFKGLRACVKKLTGAQRWGERCRSLEDQIVGYIRECFGADARSRRCALRVD